MMTVIPGRKESCCQNVEEEVADDDVDAGQR